MSPTEERYGLVLDFDGTVTAEDELPLVHRIDTRVLTRAGKRELDEVRARYQPLAQDGGLTPAQERDWLEATFRVYAREEVTFDAIYGAVDDVRLRQAAIPIIRAAVEAGLEVAIVSFGLRQAIRRVLARKGLPVDRITVCAADLSVDAVTRAVVGHQEHSFVLPCNKGDWSRKFARAKGIPFRNLLAAGDSPGDRHLGHHKRNRLGLARDEAWHARLKPHCGRVEITDTFHAVGHFIRERTGLKL
jgi:phosphoserine phosphatase